MYFTVDKSGSKRTQPPWQPSSGSVDVGLQIFNSLTRKKVGIGFMQSHCWLTACWALS